MQQPSGTRRGNDHGLSCKPSETCFCSVFGIDAAEPAGDVSCWLTDNAVLMQANTEKGEALLASLPMLEDAADDAAEESKAKTKAILEKLPLKNLSTDSFGGDKLMELFSSDKWASLSEACLGCGTCTFVCPTCQCYDIKDYDTGHGVQRFRCWDSAVCTLTFTNDSRRSAASHTAGAFPSAVHAQAGLLSRQTTTACIRLRWLRSLREELPDFHEHCKGHEDFRGG